MMQEQAAISNLQQQEPQIKCPRCESTNTKFSYYNNYNLSQPRHYCKGCRRYWTVGGAIRDVPVGGGSRKSSKRSSSSSSSSSSSKSKRSLPSPEPTPASYPVSNQDEQMLDFTGSFTSLLASDGHFSELLEGFGVPNSRSLRRPFGETEIEP